MEFSHRQRTNTAQRLEEMDQEKKRASKIKHVKWKYNPNYMTLKEQQELFKSKELKKDKQLVKKRSLFAEQLEKCPDLPQNPFVDYARFDGNVSFKILLCPYFRNMMIYNFIIFLFLVSNGNYSTKI